MVLGGRPPTGPGTGKALATPLSDDQAVHKGRTIRLQGGGAGSFCKKKNLTHSKVKKKKLDPHIEGKKKKT